MQTSTNPAVPHRDNLIGVCAAIGEDFGFNPDILRVLFAAALLWNPVAVLIAYAAAGVLVLASRVIVPNRKRVRQAVAA